MSFKRRFRQFRLQSQAPAYAATGNLAANERFGYKPLASWRSIIGIVLSDCFADGMMAVRTDLYPEGLIRAIDCWQSGPKGKARKARRLRDWIRELPYAYRAAPETVFRQMRINAQLGVGIALDAIPEATSSWTTSLEVARRFREEDQDRRKVILIFARHPAPEDIILNLNAVYADSDFMDTVNATATRLNKHFAGIERWRGTQQEVVLKETTLGNDEIVSLGAFRELNDVVPLIGTPVPNALSDDQIFTLLTGKRPDEHFWTSPASAANGVRAVAQRAQEFLAKKRIWPNELPG
jgi:hypothetical protein